MGAGGPEVNVSGGFAEEFGEVVFGVLCRNLKMAQFLMRLVEIKDSFDKELIKE